MLEDQARARPATPRPDGASSPSRLTLTSSHALYVIVFAGAILRLFPIWFGLPYLRARPDEETALAHALEVLRGHLNPHFFHWPSLTFYVLAAVLEAASWIRWALLSNAALTDGEQIVIARAFVALAGTLTIVVLFRLTREIADETTGLIAAAFLAVAILHVRESHFAMTDVLMTLLVTVSLALLLGAQRAVLSSPFDMRGLRDFAAAGLAGGLAASTKYSGAAVVTAMAAVQLIRIVDARRARSDARTWTPSIAFLAAFGCGFLVATPYALLDFPEFATDLRFDFTHLSGGHVLNLDRGWSYHLTRSLPYGVGLPIFLASIAGIVPFAKHYGRPAFVIGVFASAFYLAIGSGHSVFFRYILPLVPVVCLSAAVAVHHAGTWLAARTRQPNGVVVAILTMLVGGPALVNSAWFDGLLAKTDTRVLAARWLMPRLQGEETLHEAGGVYAQLDLSGARFHRWSFDPATRSFGETGGRSPDWLVFEEAPLPYAIVSPELRQLAREQYTLVYVTRATSDRAAASAVYDLEDAFFMPIHGFGTVERPGPTVSIYRRADLPPARNAQPD